MERKIGEVFEIDGCWYQCVKGHTCKGCAFEQMSCSRLKGGNVCCDILRKDRNSVIFKKVDVIGKPKQMHGINVVKVKRDYRSCDGCVFHDMAGADCYGMDCNDGYYVQIDKNKNNMEKKNFKEFDLNEAKAGKPVCTRDGKKARIICFDKKTEQYPILALVENGGREDLFQYMNDGRFLDSDGLDDRDLVMVTEKHEGWINLYKEEVFSTKDEALKHRIDKIKYIDTIKVEWKE